MRKFKITYKITGLKALYVGAVETDSALAWFVENAPQRYKMVSCDLINQDQFSRLENLEKIFNRKL
jgi:hypothetical protein